MSKDVLTSQEFKNRAQDGKPPMHCVLRKFHIGNDTEVKIIGSERRVRFTISTAAVDRDRDTINPGGWELDNYRKNPVVLWAHDASMLPVAKSVELNVNERALTSLDEFPPEGVNPFADSVLALIKFGALNTTSVGFSPVEFTINEERMGIDFQRQELLEHSIVAVPSNAEALVQARSKGIHIKPVEEWVERIYWEVKSEELGMDPEDCVELMQILGPSQVSVTGEIVPKEEEQVAIPELDAADALINFVIDKQGRVLSRRNEDKLREAQRLIDEVVASVGVADSEEASADSALIKVTDADNLAEIPLAVSSIELVEPEDSISLEDLADGVLRSLVPIMREHIDKTAEEQLAGVKRSVLTAVTGRLD